MKRPFQIPRKNTPPLLKHTARLLFFPLRKVLMGLNFISKKIRLYAKKRNFENRESSLPRWRPTNSGSVPAWLILVPLSLALVLLGWQFLKIKEVGVHWDEQKFYLPDADVFLKKKMLNRNILLTNSPDIEKQLTD